MLADEVLELTRERICALVAGSAPDDASAEDRRRTPRWPRGGLVEIWLPGLPGAAPCFGTCRDISESGIGLSACRGFEVGSRVEIALRLPELSMHASSTVRHCAPDHGGYALGLEFDFD